MIYCVEDDSAIRDIEVYALRSTGFAAAADFAPQLAAVAVVVLLHLWRRNTLLSIAGGTAVYMILLRLL